MSQEILDAIEKDVYDDVEVNDAPDVSDVYADYQMSKEFD